MAIKVITSNGLDYFKELQDQYNTLAFALHEHTHTPQSLGAAKLLHQHEMADVNGLYDALNDKASASHHHPISGVEGLREELDEKMSLKSGTSLVTNTDLNTIKTVGNYVCNLDTVATTIKNSPTGGKAFALKVGDLLNDGKYWYQEITRYTDGASWRRTFNMASSTWNVWYSTSFAPSKKSLWTGSWNTGSITVNNIQDYSAFVFYSSTGATLIGFMNADKTSINCYGIICPESNIMKLESATIAVSGTTLTRTIPKTWTLTGTAISSADAALVFTRIEGLF